MKQEDKELLLKDLCARLPYGVKVESVFINPDTKEYKSCGIEVFDATSILMIRDGLGEFKPYLFPLSSMTNEDHATYSKIWEDTGKTAYLEGCHHLICTIKAYKAANDYLLSKYYDIDGLIPKGLASDATGKNIY